MTKITSFAKIAAAAAITALSLRATPAAARSSGDGRDRRVIVANESGQTIREVHGTPTTWRTYGPDRIPSFVPESGEQARVNFDVGSGQCVYDLQVKLADGSTVSRRNVNVCRVTRWTITD